MNFKSFRSRFSYTQGQQNGILVLFFVIILLQLIYMYFDFSVDFNEYPEKQKWLALETEIEEMKAVKKTESNKLYPFNPNFISDYKGYQLGMSVAEIDRLFAFRKQNRYVNSAEEFQMVTHISDSLLNVIAPFFKFPNWVTNVKKKKVYSKSERIKESKKLVNDLLDINKATQEDLMKIFGVGPVISLRILKLKDDLGGFVSMEQMKDVWGVSDEVVENLNANFKMFAIPNVKKIEINNASLKELSQFPYFKNGLAKQIVIYRSMHGDIKKSSDLRKIKDFPVDKEDIIGLYLKF